MSATNQNALNPNYPEEPEFNPNCLNNTIYQSLPPTSPDYPTRWETKVTGPTSMKHIYTGVPNWYPVQTINRPIGTMYEHDYSQFQDSNIGRGKRISYHYKAYPLTNRNVRETHRYADYMLPSMGAWKPKEYPIIRDASLNSPLQYKPYPYSSSQYSYSPLSDPNQLMYPLDYPE